MTELGLFVRKKLNTTPQFTPLIPAEAILELAGKAIEGGETGKVSAILISYHFI